MPGVVEKSKTWLEIPERGKNAPLQVEVFPEKGLWLFQQPTDGRGSFYGSVTISPEDVRAFAEWVMRQTTPQPSIWDRLAAYSASPPKTPSNPNPSNPL